MSRPDVPYGYLGAQPKFAEYGLGTNSHGEPEINASSNSLQIQFKFDTNRKVKVTHQLLNCSTDADESSFVFTQTMGDTISFLISMPSVGWYKFQVFALPTDDDSKSLPNVYNYLINCTSAQHPCFPYPKQYAQWKDGCNLSGPLCLHKDMCLKNVGFNVGIPGANGVAVVAGGEWFHLDKKGGDRFEGQFDLSPFSGKDTKVTLNACLGPDESKYATMLEYGI